jgi:branched-chain amino acid transport system substrate-binding protein
MKTYGGIKRDPTLNQYIGFLSVVGFVDGLKAAGSNPSQAKFIDAMLGIRDWNAAGLFGKHSIGFALNQRGLSQGADNCIWVTRYSGTTFHLVAGADPICGKVIPGKTVSPVS